MQKNLKLLLLSKDNLEPKKSKNNDNKDNEKKEIEDNNNTHHSQYTFNSSELKKS